ncbi:hypothetical protein GGQ88_001283 [Novosphingobium hassiacum]|uniref:DUF1499 domain-containing protein n=1 Tax=Novosphingobium hassiacum TaxID=173676 RepID=A0A7W5ZVA5_9SPHN|nr:DUF1499 domain-containing protein [Novosphingobium hassiacum]MBB3860022.1 hypothetical protein [Novosphingobium hassiacum]
MANGKWTTRSSRWSRNLAVAALAIAAVGLVLARYDIVPKLTGFSAMLAGGALAIVGAVLGIVGLVLNLRHPTSLRNAAIVGLVLSLPFALFLLTRPMSANGAPSIHDITTDLANPPAFAKITLRPDNLTGVETVENWRAIHAKAYPDLKSVKIAKPAAATFAAAQALVTKRGWKVAAADPAKGTIEATATVSFIRFNDDVAIRIVPTDDGAASLVDMRSVSRVGIGDLGVNAKRIRSFLGDLAENPHAM